MSKKRKSAFDKINQKKKVSLLEAAVIAMYGSVGQIDWDDLIEKNENLAAAVVFEHYGKISDIAKLMLIVCSSEKVRELAFLKFQQGIEKNQIKRVNDPLWRTALRHGADFSMQNWVDGNFMPLAFLTVCVAGHYPKNELTGVTFEHYAALLCGNESMLPDNSLDWLFDKIVKPSNLYTEVVRDTLNDPQAAQKFSEAVLSFMRGIVAKWEVNDLLTRHAEVVKRPKPMAPAL